MLAFDLVVTWLGSTDTDNVYIRISVIESLLSCQYTTFLTITYVATAQGPDRTTRICVASAT